MPDPEVAGRDCAILSEPQVSLAPTYRVYAVDTIGGMGESAEPTAQ
jgi:hypothetical protein